MIHMIKCRHIIFVALIVTWILSVTLLGPASCAADDVLNDTTASLAANRTVERPPEVLWTRTFGGAGNDTGSAINLASGGGFIIAGNTYSSGGGGSDIYLVRTDANGNKQWEKTIGGWMDDEGFGVLQAKDGNFVVVGYTRSRGSGGSDIYLLKVDQNGDPLWQKTYGGPADDFGYALLEAPDGGYLLAGYTYSSGNGGSDAYLIKTDSGGDLQWQKTYGGSADDQVFGINATADGGYVMAGWSRSFSDSQDFYEVKTDADGTLQWQKKSPRWDSAKESYSSWAYSVLQKPDGGYLVNGWQLNPDGNRSMRLLSLTPDGEILKNVTYFETNKSTSTTYQDGGYSFGYTNVFARSMILAAEGGVLITGPAINTTTGNRESYVFKSSFDRQWGWYKKFNISTNDSSRGIVQTPDGGYVVTGWTYQGNGGSDVLLLKLTTQTAEPAPVSGQPDIVRPAAAVVVGTALGLLGLFWSRVQEVLAAVFAKLQAVLKPILDVLNKMFPIDTVFDFVYGYVKTTAKALAFKQEGKTHTVEAKERIPFLAGFSSLELLVIVITSVFLGAAFLITRKIEFNYGNIVLYILIAGLATILHDLTHRYTAYRYKVTTEYQFWLLGTVVMFVTAFLFGLAYGAPGRTLIKDSNKMGVKEQAIVALSGPVMSFGVTLAFFLLVPIGGWFKVIGLLGVSMNLLSAVYGLMPFDPMDGKKVYGWKKAAWAVAFLPMFIIYFLAAIYLL